MWLLEVAHSVAELFVGRQPASREEIPAAVRRAPGFDDDEKAFAAQTTPGHLGFLRRSGVTRDREPGMPGLMDYLREFVPPA